MAGAEINQQQRPLQQLAKQTGCWASCWDAAERRRRDVDK